MCRLMAQQLPSPSGPVASPPSGDGAGRDWAATAADTIDHYVMLVRDRTTRPALLASRALVFGLILAVLGITALVLVWIAWVTLITELVGEVWITYFITGGIFVLVGAFLMTKRHPPEVGL
jgi:hypothetical protein